jgi:hypothetical protein
VLLFLAMVDYYTTSSTSLTFDQSNILKIIIIVSTTCFSLLHNSVLPYTDFVTQSVVNIGIGKVIIIRVSICYDYRHDLNSFSSEVVESIIRCFGTQQQKVAVIIEE